MKDNEKQIEELATFMETTWTKNIIIGDKWKWFAEELLKHYQPKLLENSVVLSKKEYETLQNDSIEFLRDNCGFIVMEETGYEAEKADLYCDGYETGKKKTAEKYIELRKYLEQQLYEHLKAKTENSDKYKKANTSSDRDSYYIEFHKVNANIELIKKIIIKFDELAKQFGVEVKK